MLVDIERLTGGGSGVIAAILRLILGAREFLVFLTLPWFRVAVAM